jgi:DNA-binding transcriptional regulator YiaG
MRPKRHPRAVADAALNEPALALAHHLTAIKDQRQLSQRGFAALIGLSQASATERQGSAES